MPGERKLATVLFADIVGSTAAGRSHDPEVVRGALGGAFERLRQVLEAHGGTVEKFIGDAVMAVFGVPIAHDDDADRAVRAAFQLRRAIGAVATPFPLELRIGVNSGEVVSGSGEGGQFLVTGDAVNAAARLQQAATPGQILVGAVTHEMTGRGVRYGRKRAIKAKGIGALDAWPAEELESELPEQKRGIEGLRAPLVGRDEEMRLLLDTYRRVVSDGKPAMVTIFAPAGTGKTRLTQEFVETIGGSRVLRGRCLPYGEGITYWAVQEIVRADVGISAMDARVDAARKLRTAVLTAFGGPSDDAEAVARRLSVLAGVASAAEALPGVAPDAMTDELRWGLRRYLDRRAAAAPITLVFEDIHWAEAGLLDTIDHLADRLGGPAFLLCLARPELLEQRPGWGGGKTNAASIALEPLTEAETRRLIAELLAIDALPDAVRAEVIARAEGNPLYVEEFLRMLIESGQVEKRRGRWVATEAIAELQVPPTVQGLIAARLDRLPPDVKRTLMRAAVVGKVFWTTAVSALDPDASEPRASLAETVRRGIVYELDERGLGGGAAYRFKHIIVRDVAYAAIPKADRVGLHDRFSRWLEEAAGARLDEYLEIVGHHAEQAFALGAELSAPDRALGQRALDFALAAGRRARERADWSATLTHYRRAAGIADRIDATPTQRAEARGFAAVARHWVESSAESIAALDREIPTLREAGPSEALVWALRTRGFAFLSESAERARPLLYEGLEVTRRLDDPGLLAESLVWAGNWAHWVGDREEFERLTEEALRVAEAAGAVAPRAQALRRLAGLAGGRGEFARQLAMLEESWRLAQESGSLLERTFSAGVLLRFYLTLGDLDAARRWEGVRSEAARDIGVRELVARSAETESDLHDSVGEHARARDVLARAISEMDHETMRGSLPELRWKLARAHFKLGEMAEARVQAERALAETQPDDPYSQATTRAMLASVRAAEGDGAAAEALYREAIRLMTSVTPQGREIRLSYARFLVDQGRGEEARAELEALRQFFADPLAHRRRAEVEDLLARATAPRAQPTPR